MGRCSVIIGEYAPAHCNSAWHCRLVWGADADLILRHGKIVTVDSKFSIQQAIAIRGGKIVAVGSDAAVFKANRGPRTR